MKVYEPGQKLRDTLYGAGVVLEADPEYTTIRFRHHGIKKFITSMLQMEAVGPAPVAKSAAGAPHGGERAPETSERARKASPKQPASAKRSERRRNRPKAHRAAKRARPRSGARKPARRVAARRARSERSRTRRRRR